MSTQSFGQRSAQTITFMALNRHEQIMQLRITSACPSLLWYQNLSSDRLSSPVRYDVWGGRATQVPIWSVHPELLGFWRS